MYMLLDLHIMLKPLASFQFLQWLREMEVSIS